MIKARASDWNSWICGCCAICVSISERASGNISVELYRPQTVLYSRIVFPWEVERGFISISYPFEHAIQNLEIRLRVPPRCEGSIKQLSIQQQAKD